MGLRQALETLGSTDRVLLESMAIIAVLVVVRWLVLMLVRRKVPDARARYTWRKGTAYAGMVLAVFLVGRLWIEGIGTLATFLGLVGAGVVVALRDPVLNMAGWFFLLWRRPFVVGDRIQIGDHAGDVIDLRLFQFTLLEIGNWVHADQSTGRLVHVPNGRVFHEPLANYTRGFPYIWNEIPVRVTFESDWRAAKEILLEIVNRRAYMSEDEARQHLLRASHRFMIVYSTLTPTVYTSADESGVVLTLRYLCDARQRRGTAQTIWEDVLSAFGERDDIGLAYPTRRWYAGPEGPAGGAGLPWLPGSGSAGDPGVAD
jgi:small-conductance mechanosensitive channel